MSAIELKNVCKDYGAHPVLTDINLTIQKAERVVLHGPSGCGKTTILRLIAGFLTPDRGSVSIDGNVAALDGKTLVTPERRGLGMVFQDLALWPHLTVFENLEFALKAQGLAREMRHERIEKLLRLVKLDGSAKAYPSKLSGGQQQRVAIARSLVAQPVALLMDEPLSNLDDELKDELCGQILSLHAELGFTLVYVTQG